MIIAASSSNEDGSTAFTRQRSIDSRTNTMVNTSATSLYLQSPVSSQLRNVTFLSSSRNDLTSKINEPLTRRFKSEARKQANTDDEENVTALSLGILRHTEILQSLLDSVEANELVSLF